MSFIVTTEIRKTCLRKESKQLDSHHIKGISNIQSFRGNTFNLQLNINVNTKIL